MEKEPFDGGLNDGILLGDENSVDSNRSKQSTVESEAGGDEARMDADEFDADDESVQEHVLPQTHGEFEENELVIPKVPSMYSGRYDNGEKYINKMSYLSALNHIKPMTPAYAKLMGKTWILFMKSLKLDVYCYNGKVKAKHRVVDDEEGTSILHLPIDDSELRNPKKCFHICYSFSRSQFELQKGDANLPFWIEERRQYNKRRYSFTTIKTTSSDDFEHSEAIPLHSNSIIHIGNNQFATFCFLLPSSATPYPSQYLVSAQKKGFFDINTLVTSVDYNITEASNLAQTDNLSLLQSDSFASDSKSVSRRQSATVKSRGEDPPYSLEVIIAQSIKAHRQKKRTAKSVIKWMQTTYPKSFDPHDLSWQQQIRKLLASNPAFEKKSKDGTELGKKGVFWSIVQGFEDKLLTGVHAPPKKKRKRASDEFENEFDQQTSKTEAETEIPLVPPRITLQAKEELSDDDSSNET